MFYYSKCCVNVSLRRTRCEFGIAIMFRSGQSQCVTVSSLTVGWADSLDTVRLIGGGVALGVNICQGVDYVAGAALFVNPERRCPPVVLRGCRGSWICSVELLLSFFYQRSTFTVAFFSHISWLQAFSIVDCQHYGRTLRHCTSLGMHSASLCGDHLI